MKSEMMRPLVIGVLALQAVIDALLWLLDAFSVQGTAAFAFLVAGNITAFALIAHVYRTAKDDNPKGDAPAPAKAHVTA